MDVEVQAYGCCESIDDYVRTSPPLSANSAAGRKEEQEKKYDSFDGPHISAMIVI